MTTPSAAMIAGDFTALASPACNGGRQITLGAPFVGNRVTGAQLSPAALKIVSSGYLPISTDPCGRIAFTSPRSFKPWSMAFCAASRCVRSSGSVVA